MTTSPSHRRTTMLGAVLVAVALTVSACGGDDAEASDKPTKAASTSATPTSTPTPTAAPTPTEAPLSPFEDKAPVKAARAWADEAGKAVNAHDKSLSSLTHVTDHGRTRMAAVLETDLREGFTWPGPQPFTPVNLRVRGKAATISACALAKGWSLGKSGKPVNAREVKAYVFQMKKVGGRWLLDDLYSGTGDCAGVRVKGVKW